jgi:hypothetical protein
MNYHVNLFVLAILGHFVGDYLFQNQWMATEKSFPGERGHWACSVHVFLYTVAVMFFLARFWILRYSRPIPSCSLGCCSPSLDHRPLEPSQVHPAGQERLWHAPGLEDGSVVRRAGT